MIRDPAAPMVFETESLQGLKPVSSRGMYGTAEAVPFQSTGSDDFRIHWSSWALAPFALVLSVLAVPYLLTHGFLPVAFALQRGFALVCHQRPERSFWIFGAPVAVCARCLGIYLGAAMGLLLRTSRRIALRLLIVAAVLNLLDIATELAGLHGNWMGVRFALGLSLGAAAGLLISSSTQRVSTPDPSPGEAGS